MLRDFPVTLQRSGEAVIPPRPHTSSASQVPPASYYYQRYVSHSSDCSLDGSQMNETISIREIAFSFFMFILIINQIIENCLRNVPLTATVIINSFTENKNKHRQQWVELSSYLHCFSSLLCCCVLQFQTVAGSHSDTNANRGEDDGRSSVQAQSPAAVLPVYITRDRLTLAVLTLLLGGWLAFALTYPAVSLCVCCLYACGFKTQFFRFYSEILFFFFHCPQVFGVSLSIVG